MLEVQTCYTQRHTIRLQGHNMNNNGGLDMIRTCISELFYSSSCNPL